MQFWLTYWIVLAAITSFDAWPQLRGSADMDSMGDDLFAERSQCQGMSLLLCGRVDSILLSTEAWDASFLAPWPPLECDIEKFMGRINGWEGLPRLAILLLLKYSKKQ